MENLSCDCNIIHEEVVYNTKKKLEEIKIFNDVSNFFKIIGVSEEMVFLCQAGNGID